MKYIKPLLTLAFLVVFLNINAQTVQDILKDKNLPVTFFGIDFTAAKLIGDANAKTGDIVRRQFTGINELMLKESAKYDFAGAFKRNKLAANLEIVNQRNEAIDSAGILSSNTADYQRLAEKDIAEIVSKYNTGSTEGYGLLLVIEGMSKAQKSISGWIVLFDNKSKKILLGERHEGSTGMAFSFRNYWAAGIKNIIGSIAAKNNKRN